MSLTTLSTSPTIVFPEDYDAQSEFETPARGYLSDVIARLDDGTRYRLYFIDQHRLAENLADEIATGRTYYTEPNLIVLPRVTTETVRDAINGLWRDGVLQNFKPL